MRALRNLVLFVAGVWAALSVYAIADEELTRSRETMHREKATCYRIALAVPPPALVDYLHTCDRWAYSCRPDHHDWCAARKVALWLK